MKPSIGESPEHSPPKPSADLFGNHGSNPRPARRIARRFFLGATPVLLAAIFMRPILRSAPSPEPVEPLQAVALAPGFAERLGGALRIRTISTGDSTSFDSAAFQSVHAYLRSTFPLAHTRLQRETVGRHSLLYTWKGSDPSLRPVLLAGHLDVVPVEAGTESKWLHDPFSGRVDERFIWGRGAIDNKSMIVGSLEAVEMLLREGFQPKRTVYLAFGHDEEVGGARGAREIAALLQRRNVELELVLDEGGVIADGVLPGVASPTALVGIAEKGFASVELSVEGTGGHSSLPPRQSTVGILSAAIARLEAHQMPARLDGAARQLFERISPELPAAQRSIFGNLWITRPLVLRKLEQSATTNAMIRTTTAVTVFQAGNKENVLPSHARAVVNFRILPGDSIRDVLAHVRDAVDDPRVQVRLAPSFTAEASGLSSTESSSYRMLERTIRGTTRGVLVAPYLVVVVTDSRYYANLSRAVFRFLPLRLAPEDLARMHGTDERLSITEYGNAIRFYRQLVINASANGAGA